MNRYTTRYYMCIYNNTATSTSYHCRINTISTEHHYCYIRSDHQRNTIISIIYQQRNTTTSLSYYQRRTTTSILHHYSTIQHCYIITNITTLLQYDTRNQHHYLTVPRQLHQHRFHCTNITPTHQSTNITSQHLHNYTGIRPTSLHQHHSTDITTPTSLHYTYITTPT